jgi:hypothetical protein
MIDNSLILVYPDQKACAYHGSRPHTGIAKFLQQGGTMMKRFRVAAAACTVALTGTCMGAAFAADDAAPNPGAEKVWVTDFSGRPPFARRAVSAAEFARFEETKRSVLPAVGERLHIVDSRGRPPFRRQIVDVDASNVAEFARFEETKPSTGERRRFGPPGKGFPRR